MTLPSVSKRLKYPGSGGCVLSAVNGAGVQSTATFVAFAVPTTPEPVVTTQFWLGAEGCVATVTE
jgi:hypothetical protein